MRLSALCLLAALASPAALHADTYNFSIVTADTSSTPGSSFTVNGTITGPADAYASGAFDINAITGAANIYTFSGIVNAGTDSQHPATQSGFTFDNVLYTATGANHVDSNGFLLDLSSPLGISLAHVYYSTGLNPGYEVDVVDPNDPGDVTPFRIASFDISPSTVPEPSTFALLGTGLLGLTSIARRRIKRS